MIWYHPRRAEFPGQDISMMICGTTLVEPVPQGQFVQRPMMRFVRIMTGQGRSRYLVGAMALVVRRSGNHRAISPREWIHVAYTQQHLFA